MFEELETVVLTRNIESERLKKDDIGVVVEVYGKGEAYEVEFLDENTGRTISLITLHDNDIYSINGRATSTSHEIIFPYPKVEDLSDAENFRYLWK